MQQPKSPVQCIPCSVHPSDKTLPRPLLLISMLFFSIILTMLNVTLGMVTWLKLWFDLRNLRQSSSSAIPADNPLRIVKFTQSMTSCYLWLIGRTCWKSPPMSTFSPPNSCSATLLTLLRPHCAEKNQMIASTCKTIFFVDVFLHLSCTHHPWHICAPSDPPLLSRRYFS